MSRGVSVCLFVCFAFVCAFNFQTECKCELKMLILEQRGGAASVRQRAVKLPEISLQFPLSVSLVYFPKLLVQFYTNKSCEC